MEKLRDLHVDEDIRKASTLPSWFYTDPAVFAAQRGRVFARAWQLVETTDRVREPGRVLPFTLLPGALDEPLLLARDDAGKLRCLSNVCTHRGNLVLGREGTVTELRCGYHGRRFALDGRFKSMPEFEGAKGFPSAADDLPQVPLGAWEQLVFVALDPLVPLAEILGDVRSRCGWLPWSQCALDADRSRDYAVRANWMLYVDNYLEGLHIPHVHKGLAAAIDYPGYRTELFPWSSLQLGVARADEDAFEPPASSPDHGLRIAAYYFWLFPNTMLNVYPWGVSVNVVRPVALDRAEISFLAFVWDRSRLDRGAGADLEAVEREDEAVVEAVQRGMRSRLYDRGRYSPARETGVHHFHRLLVQTLAERR